MSYLFKANKPMLISEVPHVTKQIAATNRHNSGLWSKNFLPANIPTDLKASINELMTRSANDKFKIKMLVEFLISLSQINAPIIAKFPSVINSFFNLIFWI